MTIVTRDKLKDYSYFEIFLDNKLDAIKRRMDRIKNGNNPKKKVMFHKMILEGYLHITIAQFSMGKDIDSIKKSYLQTLNYLNNHDCWNANKTKVTFEDGSQSNQYKVEEHGTILRLLALGVLLKVTKEEFSILVALIERDRVDDLLYEILIRVYYPERSLITNEIYDLEHSVILKVYPKLREAIALSDNSAAEALINSYLHKDFYHKLSGFHNAHKSEPVKTYYGYWSFEAAAITCILGLDDKSYRKNKYYPADLVDYWHK